MPIVRVKKDPGNFFLMAKEPIEDPNLSWKAKGLLAYLMSKPTDWQIWTKDLVKRSTDGRDAVLSGLQELKANHYASRTQPRRKNGTLGPVEYTVYESPQTDYPLTVEPLTVEPLTDNPTYTNNDCTNNDCTENDSSKQPAPKTQPPATLPTDQSDWDEQDHANLEIVLKSWVQEFGRLTATQIEKMIGLWNKYPELEIHEYAWNEMVEAKEKGIRANLTYYEKCLDTEARQNWIAAEKGDNNNGKEHV